MPFDMFRGWPAARSGIQLFAISRVALSDWIPAFAGMTVGGLISADCASHYSHSIVPGGFEVTS